MAGLDKILRQGRELLAQEQAYLMAQEAEAAAKVAAMKAVILDFVRCEMELSSAELAALNPEVFYCLDEWWWARVEFRAFDQKFVFKVQLHRDADGGDIVVELDKHTYPVPTRHNVALWLAQAAESVAVRCVAMGEEERIVDEHEPAPPLWGGRQIRRIDIALDLFDDGATEAEVQVRLLAVIAESLVRLAEKE